MDVTGATSPRTGKKEDSHQARKSEATRNKIIDAAIKCLLDYGYAKTTTPLIAQKAGLSRGAMMHHFSNRLTIIQKVIEHLHAKRLRAFKKASATIDPGKSEIHESVVAYWQQVNHPLFLAFHELSVAARTDPDLAAILEPARAEFKQEWYDVAVQMFPQWQGAKERFDIALHLSQNLLEGMAINRFNGTLEDHEAEQLLNFLEKELRALRPDAK